MNTAQTFFHQRELAQNEGKSEPGLVEFGEKFLATLVPQVRADQRKIIMIIFEDLSGFFAYQSPYKQASHIEPWPEEAPHRRDLEIFEIPSELVPEDIMATMSPLWSGPEHANHAAFDDIFSAAARQVADAPEGLLEFIVETDKSWTWQDPETSDDALILLAQAAWVIAGGHCSIQIYGAAAEGQSPTQRRIEEGYRTLSDAYAMNWPGANENYQGLAYATYDEDQPSEAPDSLLSWKSARPLSMILAEISREILKEYGRPAGWKTNYNDGSDDRCSGYSADAEIECHDTTMMSAHEIVEAHNDLKRFISERGLKPRLSEIVETEQLHDHSFADLLRNLD